MKKFVTAFGIAVASIVLMVPAHANSGNFSFSEWLATCDGNSIACDGAYFQNHIESAVCDCTGTVVNRWVGLSGNDRKRIQYDNNGGTANAPGYTYVEYVQNDANNWKATGKRYCDSSGCTSHGSMD